MGEWKTINGRPVYIDRKGRRAATYLSQMSRESEDRAAAAEGERKAATYYAIFPHSINGKPTGRGNVTRETNAAGEPHDHRNYGGVSHIGKVYKRRSDADRAMARLG